MNLGVVGKEVQEVSPAEGNRGCPPILNFPQDWGLGG